MRDDGSAFANYPHIRPLPKAHSAPISYEEAISRIESFAQQHKLRLPSQKVGLTKDDSHHRGSLYEEYGRSARPESGNDCVIVPLLAAVGRDCATNITAPHSIPTHDTSAMDGFAVSSALTGSASNEEPVRLRISHLIAAGDRHDAPIDKKTARETFVYHGPGIHGECVEIMTGARFPEVSHSDLDAVIKIEDVIVKRYGRGCDCCFEYIEVSTPVRRNQNRRFAGSDLTAGAPILAAGVTIQPEHVMALASLGFREVRVKTSSLHGGEGQVAEGSRLAGIKIGVLSTGSELTDIVNPTDQPFCASAGSGQRIPNSNGPYIISKLRQMDAALHLHYMGIAQDSEKCLESKLRDGFDGRQLDIIIATGGVSMGSFDLVRPVLEQRMHAKIVFHGVRVRPGLPVLFALLGYEECAPGASSRRMAVFFGLPGNPIATAMALRFFVTPYLAALGQIDLDGFKSIARIQLSPRIEGRRHGSSTDYCKALSVTSRAYRAKPAHLSVFWLSRRCRRHEATLGSDQDVEILEDQASYKLRSLLQADCWIEVPAGRGQVSEADLLVAHRL
ncbi:hypothetical protein H2200_008351 [Cladophialophora chaetospira]|uniref:MoaB/Mog domain-containing protein n=1 Tax=Cladophialophora chaetospira TaxID=386627 RepID=A0AA38X5L2_9EURO|nr:hypothetical protein H2200_008351 [Cladophialophora chaetospira]